MGRQEGLSPGWSLPLSGRLLQPHQLPFWRPSFTRKATVTPAADSHFPAQDTSAARTLNVHPGLCLSHPRFFPDPLAISLAGHLRV